MALTACQEPNDKSGFSFLEEADDSSTLEQVRITSFSPTMSPVVFLSSNERTFGVGVNSGSGEVEYAFELDGVVTQSSNVPFYNLAASNLTPGAHVLVVTARNKLGSDSKTFDLLRNTAPIVALSSATSPNINCSSDTYSISVVATDADGDAISFQTMLNGALNSPFVSESNTSNSSSVVFTPNCSMAGVNALTLRAIDANGEYADYSVPVTVTNPNSASIDSFFPTTNPTVILSTSSTDFILSASGNPPLSFTWDITPGAAIASCDSLSTCPISGADFTPGAYVLRGLVTDAAVTSDFQNFNIVINDRPTISSATPANGSNINMNCGVSKNFSINIEDLNHSNPGQSFTVTWYLDGNPNASLTSSTETASYPMTSTATFSPACSPLLLGDHVLSVVVSDGYESSTANWNVNTNYFSEPCNNLAPGEICTLAGLPGMGSGLDFDNERFALYPNDMIPHPNGGWLISDGYYHVIWYYNSTLTTKTILGTSVNPEQIVAVAGLGQNGVGTDGQNARNFYLNDPRGLAFSTTGELYVADYGNNRIVHFSSAGTGSSFAGGGNGNTDSASRLSHKCRNPVALFLDETANRLYTSCYGNTTNNTDGSLKYFLTNTDEGYTLVRKGSSNVQGSIGGAGSARSMRAYSLVKHPNKDILFVGELEKCQILAVSFGDTDSFYNGAVNLSANSTVKLTNNNGCGNTLNKLYTDTAGRIRPYSLAVKSNGSGIDGIFYSNNSNHNIGFLNTGNATVTIGGQDVDAGKYLNVFGTSSANKSRTQPAALASYLRNPLGIHADAISLYVADRGNYSIATLDHSVGDGTVSDMIGISQIGGYDGEVAMTLTAHRLNNPMGMDYSPSQNALYFTDVNNYRLRKIDLSSGQLTTAVGRGQSGASNTNPEAPFDAYMRNVRDVAYNDTLNGLFYSDTEANTGANRNCLARFFNEANTSQNILGVVIPSFKTSTIAGNYLYGCNTWNLADEGNDAVNVNLYEPWGIIASDDGDDLYLSSNNGHCIHHINSSGTITTAVGECGTSGDVSGALSFARLNNVGDLALDPDPVLRSYPNYFVIDRTRITNSSVKYVNNSPSAVTIAGVSIGPNEIAKIVSGIDYAGAVAAFGNQICYSLGAGANGSGYAHIVTCIDRVTGLPTLRVGKAPAGTVKAGVQNLNEDEGVNAGNALIAQPHGLAFDSQGNLYITLITNNVIKKVKRWW